MSVGCGGKDDATTSTTGTDATTGATENCISECPESTDDSSGQTTEPATSDTGCDTDCPATSESDSENCGPNLCGPCQEGCTNNDYCEMGEWVCECVCDSGSDTDATTGGNSEVMCVGEEPSFPSFNKDCGDESACALVFHTVDCCGNEEAWGIHVDEVPAFEEAEAICDSQYPGCGCPSGPVVAEDGNAAWHDAIAVKCEAGQCMSYVP